MWRSEVKGVSGNPGYDPDDSLSCTGDIQVSCSLTPAHQQGEHVRQLAAAVWSFSQCSQSLKAVEVERFGPRPVSILRQQIKEDRDDIQMEAEPLSCRRRFCSLQGIEL